MTRVFLGPGFCATAGLIKVPILLGHPVEWNPMSFDCLEDTKWSTRDDFFALLSANVWDGIRKE